VITTSIKASKGYHNPNAPQAVHARKLEDQGLTIGSSVRVRYVLIHRGDGRQALKWETPEAVEQRPDLFRLDYTAYVKRTVNALDACLAAAYGSTKTILNHAKLRSAKDKVLSDIRRLGRPRVVREG